MADVCFRAFLNRLLAVWTHVFRQEIVSRPQFWTRWYFWAGVWLVWLLILKIKYPVWRLHANFLSVLVALLDNNPQLASMSIIPGYISPARACALWLLCGASNQEESLSLRTKKNVQTTNIHTLHTPFYVSSCIMGTHDKRKTSLEISLVTVSITSTEKNKAKKRISTLSIRSLDCVKTCLTSQNRMCNWGYPTLLKIFKRADFQSHIVRNILEKILPNCSPV